MSSQKILNFPSSRLKSSLLKNEAISEYCRERDKIISHFLCNLMKNSVSKEKKYTHLWLTYLVIKCLSILKRIFEANTHDSFFTTAENYLKYTEKLHES